MILQGFTPRGLLQYCPFQGKEGENNIRMVLDQGIRNRQESDSGKGYHIKPSSSVAALRKVGSDRSPYTSITRFLESIRRHT